MLLNMQTKDGKADVAVLSVSCRPKHHLNLQMVMKQRRARMGHRLSSDVSVFKGGHLEIVSASSI